MENKKRFLSVLIGILILLAIGGASWWGYATFLNPAPEAVYAQMRSAMMAGNKEKIKSLIDASALDPEAMKQFEKLTPEKLQKMADFLAPDIAKFTPVSSDIKENELIQIKRLDEPGTAKVLSTTLVAIEFVKQNDGRTYKIGRVSGNSENTDSGDKKEHEVSVQKDIRRLRREFNLAIEPSKLSLREQLEEASSDTIKPRFSEDKSRSIKFFEAVQTENHAAYVKTEEDPKGEGLDIVVMGFDLEDGEWSRQVMGDASSSFFPPPSGEQLKETADRMKNEYFIQAVGWDFRNAVRRDDYESAVGLFSKDSGQTAEKLKNFISQFPSLKDGLPFIGDIQDANATLDLGLGEQKTTVDLVKENGVWKISKITPPASPAAKEE
ncbi:hypothetical protein HZA43_04775 [Candidatus Peregrinibacteria bacterium]|nr:hypothetical protein [Candidatus Peregrinibacteria bacterium]